MSKDPTTKHDFRMATDARRPPRAVVDPGMGALVASLDLNATSERLYRALTTDEVERWWGHPDFYRQTGWRSDPRVCGTWSVAIRFNDGSLVSGGGEFADLDPPRKVVMTRRFDKHPLLGPRETTISYRFDPIPGGTRLTVREEGFLGRLEAAYGNAEHWERVLGWLDAHVADSATFGPSTSTKKGAIVAKVVFGNHSAVIVPRTEKDAIRRFYCDVLGCEITRELDWKDDVRLGADFYIAFIYGDDAAESEFLRTGKSIWLEIKCDDVEEMSRKILEFGVRKLDIPDSHLYFQAPGGQVLRLVGINEDLSQYERAQ